MGDHRVLQEPMSWVRIPMLLREEWTVSIRSEWWLQSLPRSGRISPKGTAVQKYSSTAFSNKAKVEYSPVPAKERRSQSGLYFNVWVLSASTIEGNSLATEKNEREVDAKSQ